MDTRQKYTNHVDTHAAHASDLFHWMISIKLIRKMQWIVELAVYSQEKESVFALELNSW